MLIAGNACHAFEAEDVWKISKGTEFVTEFRFRHLPCIEDCHAFSVAGRPDEIFVSSSRKDILLGIRRGQVQVHHDDKISVLNYKTKTASMMSLERFLKLDIVFEELPVSGYRDYPTLKYGGKPDEHNYVAPIRKNGKEFVATLSSKGRENEKTTFGMPGIIPFWGRTKWFQKETTYSGTLFLEVFDMERPSEPLLQLQKNYQNLSYLPSIFDMASWTQGSKPPFLVVVCAANLNKAIPARILLIRLQ